tara:strand:- start:30 stop:356 length:327 start_codon:yes stop_codon:yes gene_type:complete
MAVTWSVVSLDSTKTVGSLSDVVTTVHWTASDSETVGEETYTGSSYGSVGLAEADSSSFTAYADIKESDAVTWAKTALGSDQITAIETSIAAQITEAKTPTTTFGVPW